MLKSADSRATRKHSVGIGLLAERLMLSGRIQDVADASSRDVGKAIPEAR